MGREAKNHRRRHLEEGVLEPVACNKKLGVVGGYRHWFNLVALPQKTWPESRVVNPAAARPP